MYKKISAVTDIQPLVVAENIYESLSGVTISLFYRGTHPPTQPFKIGMGIQRAKRNASDH